MVASHILNFLRVDDSKTILLNLCTAIGAWGGFPDAPAIFTRTVESYPMLKWVLLCVLIFQGGGEQDFQLAVELTVIIYFIYNILESYEQSKQELF
ncbi:uncharacterized protein METZ01_LOCUS408479 [marine metagenome]|uniref:Uncharacterized protein n=1 Tax=marine metagenome TaxID=408172 RepID=A0A382WB70_9ZZZZ